MKVKHSPGLIHFQFPRADLDGAPTLKPLYEHHHRPACLDLPLMFQIASLNTLVKLVHSGVAGVKPDCMGGVGEGFRGALCGKMSQGLFLHFVLIWV